MTGHRQRYRQIAETLSRHGMGYLVGVLGLERWVPFHRGLLSHERREVPYTRPEHLRLALEQLGATFVKLGQVLSTRADLLPGDYQSELAKLQDAAPQVPAEAVAAEINRELGQGPLEAFARFTADPLASASIGQAHLAALSDGSEVVVKVRRPGIVEQVEEDLEVLANLASRASRRWAVAADVDLVGLGEEFADTLRAELDYLQEGRNAERFAANFAEDPDVHIPRVLWETTTSRVLTLERIQGIKVSDLEALDAAGIDRRELAVRATRVAAKMVFEDGFFHADPHPGNLFIEPDGRIGLIDFGMVGTVDEPLREQLGTLLVALARSDADRFTDAVSTISRSRRQPDRRRLRADLADLMSRYEGRPIGDIPAGPLIGEIFAILHRHHLQLPRELALLLKMLLMTEGMGARLDPEFHLGAVLGPYAQRLVADQFSRVALARRLGRAGGAAARLGLELPEQLQRLLSALERGDLNVRLNADELEQLARRTERVGNRLVVGIVAAALIQAVVELLTLDPSRWKSAEKPLLVLGTGAAGSLGAYLAWTARRPPRADRVGRR